MDWRAYPTRWRSLVPDHELSGEYLPLDVATPETAWAYGAVTRMIDPLRNESLILRMYAWAICGQIGICISRTNGSAFLTTEAMLAPDHGRRYVYFRLHARVRPASFLVRNYGDQGVGGLVHVEEVVALREPEVDAQILAEVNGSN